MKKALIVLVSIILSIGIIAGILVATGAISTVETMTYTSFNDDGTAVTTKWIDGELVERTTREMTIEETFLMEKYL